MSALDQARVTVDKLKRDPEVQALMAGGDELLSAMGYTEHGTRHAGWVSSVAYNVLTRLGFPEREGELAAMAGYLHDIGNVAGRHRHEQTGALLAREVLLRLGVSYAEISTIMGAIGNHEENTGQVVSNPGAALMLADKSDVHRSRVRNPEIAAFDIHDRVNYAVEHSFLRVDDKKHTVTLELTIDTRISPVMDYFEIFLSRMMLCRRAASFLGAQFELQINGVRLL
jgi:metal-dependent HD superfamily phosphatase/phosphodiesterase